MRYFPRPSTCLQNYNTVANMASPQSYTWSFAFVMTVVALVLGLVFIKRFGSKRMKRM